ncbi:WD40 repeat-like protein [Rhizoclosmatium globosum]|uniref:WD40 repeat-like protein n=1 Tax=Rhizoclosmatium globosum TaxID=329046 RepID=A0A1Y2BQU2_9FUNG|nr:WD40 repeat-like protein [Rhizoclosmatium globosum]|eukprot:ORY37104.1 WD40 repeat-like protein [Rhizoclosmatium globosum]
MGIPRYASSSSIDGPQKADTPSRPTAKPFRMQLRQTVGPKVGAVAVDAHLGLVVLVHQLPTLAFAASFSVTSSSDIHITSIALSRHAIVAVAHGSTVSLFKADTASGAATDFSSCPWIFWMDLKSNVAGESTFVDMSLEWKLVAPKPVQKIQFSPDGSLFASIAKNDRFVKVWYPAHTSKEGLQYDFLYLPHTSPVTNFEWRHQAPNKESPPANALLTVTQSSLTLIWCQINTKASVTHSAARKRQHNNAEFEMRASIMPELGTTSVHWVQGSAVSEAIEGALKDGGASSKSKGSGKRGRGAAAIKDYPDLLFAVGREGGVVVWGVQGLDGHPQRVPKVMVILKTQSGVLPGDFEAFMGTVHVFYDSARIKNSAIYFPAQISILAKSTTTGLLNLYSMNLDEFFGSPWANPYLRLEHSWCGHTTRVKRFSEHPSLPVVASTIVAVGNDPELTELQQVTPLCPITFLQVIHHFALDTDSTISYLVIGVSNEDLSVYVWEVVFEGSRYISNQLLFESSLPTGTKPVKLTFPTNTLSAVFSPVAHIGTHTFGTVDGQGVCRLWGLELENRTIEFVEAGTLLLGDEIVSVKADLFGRIVSSRKMNDGEWELSIWQGRIEDSEHIKAWSKVWTSEIVDVDIAASTDGQSLVAVATQSGVDVFCQDRLKTFNGNIEWIHIAEMTVPWEDRVHAIMWLQNGSLAAALTTKVAVFSKWKDLTIIDSTTTDPPVPTSLHSVVSRINGRLPDYHPNLLVHHLIWGKYDFIKYIFSLMHKFVKLMTEADRKMREVPAVLWKFFEQEGSADSTGANYDELFAEVGEETTSREIGSFGQAHLDFLVEMGDKLKLPHLEEGDQARLLAIMSSFVQVEQQKRSVDENGSRFVFFARLFVATERVSDAACLGSRDISWAFYSDSQDFLVDFVSQIFSGKPLWKDVRSLGMGFWLKNTEALRRQIEAIARNHYMAKEDKDPVDCALFYICLKKKNVLLGLWKLASSHPEQGAMLKFLANDFAEERWQKAAVKNAFALLGKQRYGNLSHFIMCTDLICLLEYAVAFFLLADRLKDAVNVCLKHLKDLQLAIVLCRLFEGDESPTLDETLKTNILPVAFKEGDRYLISMVYTLLKDKDLALKSTMMPINTFADAAESLPERDIIDPPLVVLHNYLQKKYRLQKNFHIEKIPALQQFHFMSASATIYENMGCPGLALDMLTKVSELTAAAIVESSQAESTLTKTDSTAAVPTDSNSANAGIDWGAPVSQQQTSNTMDWGAPVSQQPTSSAMDWGAPVSQQLESSTMDWGAPVSQQPISGGMDWGAPVSQQPSSGGMDWGAPVSQQVPSGGMDWGAPVAQQSSLGMDWGEPVQRKPADSMDEYEAFKKSMQNADEEPDELELLERELAAAELKANGGKAQPAEEAVEVAVEIVLNETQKVKVGSIRESIRYQKWKLAIRMIHSLYKSMAVVSLNMDVLTVDSVFKDYFKLLQSGIQKLANRVEMPLQIMDSAITARYQEMDAFVAFVELPSFASNDRTATGFSALLIEGSNHLSSLIFISVTRVDATTVDPIVDFSKRLLWSIIRWYEREDSGFSPISLSVMSQTSATAFLALSICSIKTRDFKSLWWIVGLSDRFFEVLVGGAKKKNLKPLILDLLTHREPIIQPDSESEDDSDDDYYGEVSAEKALLAETLLSSIALQHIGLDFQVFVRHLKDGGNVDEAYGFLSEVVLTRLSSLLFEMHQQVRSKWNIAMKLNISKMSTYLLNNYAKGVWSLIKRTANVKKLAALIIAGNNEKLTEENQNEADSTAAVKPITEDIVQTPEVESPAKRAIQVYDESSYEVVFRTKDIIGTFAINPMDPNMFAVATHETIVEFDLETSIRFHSVRPLRDEVLAKRRESVDDLAIKSTHKRFLDAPKNQPQRLVETETLKRTLSFDSLQKAVKDSMMDLRRRDSELDSGRRVHREVLAVSSLEAHPSLNYYLAGVGDGNSEAIVKLYQFGQKGDLVSYSSGTSARITKCRFDPFGGRFGCSDAKGELRLWKFDATQQSLNPTQILQCNSAITNDFAFINSSSLIATAGVSSNGSNICLFDTLLPYHKARVKSFHVTEGGAYSIAHTNKYQSIVAGGKKGDIFIFDVRQMKHRKTFKAHDTTVKSLFVDEENGLLISGAAGGDIKVWDLSMFNNDNWGSDDAALSRHGKFPGHSEKSGGMSSYGVMQISVNGNRVYTCGADGSLSRCKM